MNRTVLAALAALVLLPAVSWSALMEADAAPNPVVPSLAFPTVASGLSMPLLVTHAGDGSGRVFIVEQTGLVKVMANGVMDATPYLDVRAKLVSGGERGLLGLAFHPDFESNGKVFVSYTRKGDGANVLERYVVADPATGRPAASSGRVFLTQAQPFANHNGGHIAFGPDGFLYMGIGDGGSANDPQGNGQNRNTLLGKLLRLDVDGESLAIPADNPFANGGGRAEIWAFGLRNPWRFSFDRETGDLWLADVGQNQWEEVNYQPAGAAGGVNFGWDAWEGTFPFEPKTSALLTTFPVLEYAHGAMHCSVTGGHVYRGPSVPALEGRYLYGDFCSGVVWAALGVGPAWAPQQLSDTGFFISSFGEDEAGDVYLVNHAGTVHKIVEA